jgi:AAA domain/RepB DNA-primase from phage plasmid
MATIVDEAEQVNIKPKTRPRGTNAVKFLQQLRPKGPWVLTAIEPDGPTLTRTFTSKQSEDARQFIVERNDAGDNLYYSLNPTREAMTKKAAKQDIAAVEYLHVDIDPHDDESPDQCKQRALRQVEQFGYEPSFVIDSGNGLQLLWELKYPVELRDLADIKDLEARNHALAEAFDADPSTRNIDRIMRLPGSINFPNRKKRERGRVKCPATLLQFNRWLYRLAHFPARPIEIASPVATKKPEASELSPKLQRALYLPNKAGYPSRSELLFSFLHEAVRDRRVSDDAIVAACLDPQPGGVIYQHCQENGGQAYILRQIQRARRKVIAGDDETRPLIIRPVSRFARRELRWLWWPFIPRGMLTMLFGDGETGKSTLALDLAARVTTGARWPQFDDREPAKAKSGSVIICCKEDDVGLIIRPRLEAAGADLDRVHIVGHRVAGDSHDFDPIARLDTMATELEQIIVEQGDVRLIAIDPITDFLGEIDMYKDNHVRALMHPLAKIAARDLAIVFILHLNKNADQAARYRGLGSIAFRNVAKSSLLVAKDPEHRDRRFLAQEKKNLTAEQWAVTFDLQSAPRSAFSRLNWGERCPGVIEVDELLHKKPTKQQQAARLLRECLQDGPRPATEVKALAERRGIKPDTLKRAKAALAITSERRHEEWFWQFPRTEPPRT